MTFIFSLILMGIFLIPLIPVFLGLALLVMGAFGTAKQLITRRKL